MPEQTSARCQACHDAAVEAAASADSLAAKGWASNLPMLHLHPLVRCTAPGNYCDVGRSCCGEDSGVPIAFRCAAGCEFDVCQPCHDAGRDEKASADAMLAEPEAAAPDPPNTPTSNTFANTHANTATNTPTNTPFSSRVTMMRARGRSRQSTAASTASAPSAPSEGAPAAAALLPEVLVDATGARCQLFEHVGLCHSVALRTGRAAAIVVHLVHGKTADEMRLQESTWSQQYHQALFASLSAEGVVLQNFVYYRSTGAFASSPVHYLIMTTELEALATARVLHEATPLDGSEPTAAANLDMPRLEAYARRAIATFVPALAAHPLVPGALFLFDFSERRQSNRAAVLADAHELGGVAGQQVLVTRVGDSLQEPFWPEGLGINRGFLHAFDCADLVAGYAALRAQHDPAEIPRGACERLLERREALYAYTKRVSGANRIRELKGGTDGPFGYGVDPATRYVSLPAGLLPSARPVERELELLEA